MSSKIPSPITYNYGCMIYDALFEQSTEEPAINLKHYGYPAQENELVRVYRGSANKVTNELGFKESTGQRCMSMLAGMRCLTLIRSGGHGVLSVYILHYKPTEKQYRDYRESVIDTSAKIEPGRYQLILKELTDLRDILNKQNEIIKALDSRVAYLELLASEENRRTNG